jgi:hypothetical protein
MRQSCWGLVHHHLHSSLMHTIRAQCCSNIIASLPPHTLPYTCRPILSDVELVLGQAASAAGPAAHKGMLTVLQAALAKVEAQPLCIVLEPYFSRVHGLVDWVMLITAAPCLPFTLSIP